MESKDQLEPDPNEPRRIRGVGTGAACRVDLPSSHHGDGVERAFGVEFDQQFAAALVRPAFWRWGRCDGQLRRPQGRWSQRRCHAAGREGAAAVSGKQPGAKGTWRDAPLKTERTESHWPVVCAHCGRAFEMWDAVVRTAEAFAVLELERTDSGIRIGCVQHRYEVMRCGRETAASPGIGVLSFQGDRKRHLLLTERSLVGPSLAAFITALAVRHHQSRRRIREFLMTWFGVALAVGTLDRCLREVGVACEPIVEDLLEEVRASGVIHADETPWWQGVLGRWLWVVLHRRLPYWQPPSRGNPRPARRCHPRLAGHRWIWRLPRLRPPSKVPGAPDPQGDRPVWWPPSRRHPLRRVAGPRTARPDQGRRRGQGPSPPQPDPGPPETGLQAPPRSRDRENPCPRP